MAPLIGFLSDKMINETCGKRTPWYVFGSILVVPSIYGIWSYPEWINKQDMTDEDYRVQTSWYVLLSATYGVGWASCQVTHMAIVNQLTQSSRRRDRLGNNRNGMTSAGFIFTLSAALIIFLSFDSQIQQYRYLSYLVLICGSVCTLIYLCTIKEVEMEN